MKRIRLKRMDALMLKSVVGPFALTFMIAIFVLMMQYLWIYVDDIIGKGAGLFMLIELISYLTVSLMPMALPIAVLISSVMVLGNLAEKYELSSLKSAGVPLLRVMAPLMVAAAFVSLFSFFCSDSLIPVSNLKFKSRLYDIRKQKPTLSMEERVFNDDFPGFVIRIGKKADDNKTIEDVLIYDHSEANEGRLTEIIARKGEMYTTENEQYFVMNLYDGNQYFEVKPSFKNGRRNYPFVRTRFGEWTKVFDLSAFEIQRTDEELFKSHHSMLSTRQLAVAIDTINRDLEQRQESFAKYVDKFFFDKHEADTLQEDQREKRASTTPELANYGVRPYPQREGVKLADAGSFTDLFGRSRSIELLDKGKSLARSILSQAESSSRLLDNIRERRMKHIFEMHSKFSLAVACFIFLFIGAPMGAIIRKGGFGYPILVSIIFFMIFVILTIMCKKLAETGSLPPAVAAWVPSLTLFPIGLVLSWKAMNDSHMMDLSRIVRFLRRLLPKRQNPGA